MLVKELIPVRTENHREPINPECAVTCRWSEWYIWPLGFKGLKQYPQCLNEAAEVLTKNNSAVDLKGLY
jgi:hypothetical protein